MTKNILTLTCDEAFDFLMQSEQYHSFELPEYFDFNEVLQYVHDTIGHKSYEQCLAEAQPDEIENVNLDILLNKDGHYAVRPLILANPFLYYFLVREICSSANWSAIQECFSAYHVPHLTSCALPIIPEKQEAFHKSATILNWWKCMEQRSLELSLDYRYMFVTDISNCYGSINPQSIEWALSCKGTKLETKGNELLAQNIQKYLKALQHGHNIGIPQGSSLFDFIAEIILGYSDLLLHEELQKRGISDYEIIRYRDDYRIFCNSKNTLEQISYILQSILERLNFRMNSQKTKISDSIVTDSIKPDKLSYIYTSHANKERWNSGGIQKHLLYILLFARQYPNSGQLRNMLSGLDKCIIKKLDTKKDMWETIDLRDIDNKPQSIFMQLPTYYTKNKLLGNIRAITAVATQIALENITVCHYALRIISRIVDSLDDSDEKQLIIEKVYKKLCNQPNSDYNQLWLQNMTYTRDKATKSSCPYNVRLCKLVMGEDIEIWNNSWLKKSLYKNFPLSSIVNEDTLSKVTPIITFRETRAYDDYINNELNEH